MLVPCLCPVCCGKKVTKHLRRKHSQKLVGNTVPRDQGQLSFEAKRPRLESDTQESSVTEYVSVNQHLSIKWRIRSLNVRIILKTVHLIAMRALVLDLRCSQV